MAETGKGHRWGIFENNNDDGIEWPRAVWTPSARYWAVVNVVQTQAAVPSPPHAGKAAIWAIVASQVGGDWGDETGEWLLGSFIRWDFTEEEWAWLVAALEA